MPDTELSQFPWSHWGDASGQRWVEDIVAWFEANYERIPRPGMARQTMARLLDHIFEIVRNSRSGDGYRKHVVRLGKELKDSPLMDSSIGLDHPHHRRIMRLLELDLTSRHSHMFVLPQVRKESLLEIPDYSALLLAAKLHQVGKHQEAIETAKEIARGCSLAYYVIGQSKRKLERFEDAHVHLEEGLRLLSQGGCGCFFGQQGVAICDENLLRAVIYRAKAVVFRRQENFEEAERFYAKAEESSNEAMLAAQSDAATSIEASHESKDTLWVEHGNESAIRVATEVAADIHFSNGYYWYGKRSYDKAEDGFGKAISALERAGETWDSPYTRLAIVRFCQGHYLEANFLFARAHLMCENTTEVNSEAYLSLALCTLGSKVIQSTYHVGLPHGDPMRDLEIAIDQEPGPSLAALKCHRDDAKHFLECELSSSARKLVNQFIERIEEEISRIIGEEIHKIRDRGPDVFTHPPDRQIRVLLLAAGPTNAVRLRFDREFRNIKEQILLSIGRERFVLSLSMAVRPKDLTHALLNERPQVVHFSGHGLPDGRLCFEDEVREAHPVDPNILAELFKEFASHVFCVILNACHSEKTARAIGQHINCVIGIEQEITDKAAIKFAEGFYQALGAGRSPEEAYRLGCVQVGLHDNLERLKPILIKDGVRLYDTNEK